MDAKQCRSSSVIASFGGIPDHQWIGLLQDQHTSEHQRQSKKKATSDEHRWRNPPHPFPEGTPNRPFKKKNMNQNKMESDMR